METKDDNPYLRVRIQYGKDYLSLDVKSSEDVTLAIEFLEGMNQKRQLKKDTCNLVLD